MIYFILFKSLSVTTYHLKCFTLNIINKVNTKQTLLFTVKQRYTLFLQAIQRRVNGEESFYRNWTEYKLGFGSPNVDYWIGKENMFHLIAK